jgi:alkanesulfonate monooxygenase SsuD/methylene tetrahydromethanopterin reductase-like flavin-dependent oxidoreductase (luciferase family)/predicted kinase
VDLARNDLAGPSFVSGFGLAYFGTVTARALTGPDGFPIPEPALVWLVGPAGSGKSTWARQTFRSEEIVSTDELRARVGSGTADLDASADAFHVAELIATRRIGRGLTTVIDSLGFDDGLRARLSAAAAAAGLERLIVVFDTPPALCRERNRRRDRSVPAQVLDSQIRHFAQIRSALASGAEHLIEVHTDDDPREPEMPGATGPPNAGGPGIHLHLGRFPPANLAATLTDVARSAEGAGFAGISVMDHMIQIPQVGREWDPAPEAMAMLGHLGAVTERLTLTLLVGNTSLRQTAVFGRQMATLDVLTGGRVVCGLGAGWYATEYQAYGIDFPPAAERLDVLSDTIKAFRGLWGPGGPAIEGERISIPRAIGYPRPAAGTIPIVVGGGGERRTLRIAAEQADGWNVRGNLDVFTRKAAIVAQHCIAVDRDPATLSASVLDVPVLGGDREEVARLVEIHRGRTPASRFAARHHAGVASDHRERYRALITAGVDDIFVAPVDDDLRRAVDRLAPIVAGLASEPYDRRRTIRRA